VVPEDPVGANEHRSEDIRRQQRDKCCGGLAALPGACYLLLL
jgi:hypothetical protein